MATAKTTSVYGTLSKINVDKFTEKKSGLTYLSWSKAWDILSENYPEATYEICKFTNPVTGVTLPYLCDDELGYLVFTNITIEGITHEMWLPAMNGANKSLKPIKYTYKTKYGVEKEVEAVSMFDINKTIMRCLAKNMAMFGLGINIYSGEDFPEEEAPATEAKPAPAKPAKPAAAATKTPEEKPAATDEKPALTSQLFEKAKKQSKETVTKILENYSVNQSQRNILEAMLTR